MNHNHMPKTDALLEAAYRAAARRLYPDADVDDDARVSTTPDGAYVEIGVLIGADADEPAAAIERPYAELLDRSRGRKLGVLPT